MGCPVGVFRTLSRSPRQKMKVMPTTRSITALRTTDDVTTCEVDDTSQRVVRNPVSLLYTTLTHQWNGPRCIVGLFRHMYAAVVTLETLVSEDRGKKCADHSQ
jgi:hypothetical protein